MKAKKGKERNKRVATDPGIEAGGRKEGRKEGRREGRKEGRKGVGKEGKAPGPKIDARGRKGETGRKEGRREGKGRKEGGKERRTRCPKAICGHRYPCPAVCLKLWIVDCFMLAGQRPRRGRCP